MIARRIKHKEEKCPRAITAGTYAIIINGKRDSFEFDGKNFPEGLEAVYTCDYVLDNPYHKEKFDEYIDSLSPIISNDAKDQEAPRRGRPPKKVMEGNLD